MSFITDVHDELKLLIIATLPEANEDNVFASIKAARINLPEKVRAGTVSLPVWVLDAATFNPESQFGLHNNSGRMPLRIIEIRKVTEQDEQATILDDLTSLQSVIRETAHTTFCPIEEGIIDASPADESVAALLELGVNALAGTLSYRPGLLCGEF